MIRFSIHIFIWVFWSYMLFALMQKQSYFQREHFSRRDLQEVPALQVEKAQVFYGNQRFGIFELNTSLKKLGRTPTQLSYLKFHLGLYLKSEKIDIAGKGYVLMRLGGEPLRVRVGIKVNEEDFLMLGMLQKEKFNVKVFQGRDKKAALSIPQSDFVQRIFYMLPDLSSEKAEALLETLGFKIIEFENTEELGSLVLDYPSMDLLTEGWNRDSKEH